jgi:hypothetical protein
MEDSQMSFVKDKYRGTTLYFFIKAELVNAAQYQGLVSYKDIAVIMGLPLTGNHMQAQIGHILGEIAEDEVLAGRSMLSALAVGGNGKPGPGFFSLARELGRLENTGDEVKFWKKECEAAYESWKRHTS